MRTRTRITDRLVAALSVAFTVGSSACTPTYLAGNCARVGTAASDEALKALYAEQRRALVVMDDRSVYSCSCAQELQARQLAGDTQTQAAATEAPKRELGGDTEARQAEAPKRELGGDTQAGHAAVDAPKRELGGDTEARQTGGDAPKRELGGDTNAAAFSCMPTPTECGGFRVEGARSYFIYDGSAGGRQTCSGK